MNDFLREDTNEEFERQQKVKQTSHWPVNKEKTKIKKTNKKYYQFETSYSLGYSLIEIEQDSQVKMSFSTLKILKM